MISFITMWIWKIIGGEQIEFLIFVGSSRKLLNLEKYQFSQKDVDFGGFRISEKNIEPLPKYLDTIQTFSTPRYISDVKSWFGLINQVVNYAQLNDFIVFFRVFISPKTKLEWTSELNDCFNK